VFVHRAGVVLRAAADLKGVAAVLLEEGPFGLTWELDEPMARSSQALVDGGRVWFVDPIDEPAALERALALGRPAAVLQLLDRHNRDCAALAERLDVPHLTLPDALPDTPFEVIPLVDTRFWREVALWWAEPRVLVVAEAIGTAPAYAVGRMGAGVHIGLRLRPPRRLAAYEPEHLLVGHGPALHGPRATAALHEALGRSRRDLPRAAIALPKALVKVRR
jgi:hypothetical protein